MAQRKTAASAPKPKMHKAHGPKRNMFHDYGKCMRMTYGKLGVLSKYYDYESFQLACLARGVKSFHRELWNQFIQIKDRHSQDAFFGNLASHAKDISTSAKKVR